MNPVRTLFRRLQARVRPAMFPVLWFAVAVLAYFTPLSDWTLPAIRIDGLPLSIWGALVLATPVTSIIYWYAYRGPSEIAAGLAALDPGEVALITHDVVDATATLDTERVVSVGDTGSIGLFGASRSGKTEAAKVMLYQLLDDADQDTPVVVYDHKNDFQQFLPDDRQIRISARDSDVHWSIFAEIDSEQDIEELAREMFPARDDGNFFESAARQLLASIMMFMRRQASRENATPTNADLLTYITQNDARAIIEDIDAEEGIPPVGHLIDPDASAQSQGVLATFRERLRDLLQGDLRADGEWSLGDYFADPQGRVLIVDYPNDLGESVKPAFRLLLDLAIKRALRDDDAAIFVLDEFAQLPRLQHVDPLLNVGPGLNVRALLAFQSVAQLQRRYGERSADALLSGLLREVFLRPNDEGMLQYQREMIATEWQERDQLSYDDEGDVSGKETQEVEKRPFAKGDLTTFDPGEAIVVRRDGWVHCQLAMLDEVREQIDYSLSRDVDDDTDQGVGHVVDEDDWPISDEDLDDLD